MIIIFSWRDEFFSIKVQCLIYLNPFCFEPKKNMKEFIVSNNQNNISIKISNLDSFFWTNHKKCIQETTGWIWIFLVRFIVVNKKKTFGYFFWRKNESYDKSIYNSDYHQWKLQRLNPEILSTLFLKAIFVVKCV